MGFLSFRGMLARWINHAVPEKGPMRILEWGPGHSTLQMRAELPDAEIWTYEHDPKWVEHWTIMFKREKLENVHLHYVELEEGYSEAPKDLGLKFHFIFVDGRQRVKCMETALDLLEEGGYVMLHDSTRREYFPGKALFKLVTEQMDTAVMVRIPKESEKNEV